MPDTERPDEPASSWILILTSPMHDIAGDDRRKMTIESLITIIELALIILHESHTPAAEQIRAKRLLEEALNIHPEGFITLETNRSIGYVDWQMLLDLYVAVKRVISEPQPEVPPLLMKKLDNWFSGLDDFSQNVLLDALAHQRLAD